VLVNRTDVAQASYESHPERYWLSKVHMSMFDRAERRITCISDKFLKCMTELDMSKT
jgi:hypothetical protein